MGLLLLLIILGIVLYKINSSKKTDKAKVPNNQKNVISSEVTQQDVQNNENQAINTGKDDTLENSEMKENLNGQGAENQSIFARKTVAKDGEHICEYTEIKLSELLKQGDYVDVRLSLADGRDFTVLSGKQIMDYKKEKERHIVWLPLCEEEIIIMDSAIADTKLFEGAKLYIALGNNEARNRINYPVNHNSEKLLRPKEDDINNLSGYSYEVIFDKKLEKERKKLRVKKGIIGQEWKEAASYWNKKE